MSPLAVMSGDSSDRGRRSALHRHLGPSGKAKTGRERRCACVMSARYESAVHSAAKTGDRRGLCTTT